MCMVCCRAGACVCTAMTLLLLRGYSQHISASQTAMGQRHADTPRSGARSGQQRLQPKDRLVRACERVNALVRIVKERFQC